MKTLLLHHVEPMWEDGLINLGVNFDEYLHRIAKYIQENGAGIDTIINTRFEGQFISNELRWALDDAGIHRFIKCENYMYGWDLDDSNTPYTETNEGFYHTDDGLTFIDGGSHSKHLFVPEWINDIIGDDVLLAGCFDGECIEDMEILLDTMGIVNQRVNKLIH